MKPAWVIEAKDMVGIVDQVERSFGGCILPTGLHMCALRYQMNHATPETKIYVDKDVMSELKGYLN